MSKYTYIVNVDNAVDVSHFRMYFHESASRKKLSLYSVENMQALEGKIDHVARHVDRNVFRSDENELVICVARTWGSETDINWWTLMIQARIYHACRSVVRRKVSRIRLIIVDNDNGALPEEKVYREETDRSLLRKGCTTEPAAAHECISGEWLRKLGADYIAADEEGRQQILAGIEEFIPENPLMSGFIRDTIESFAGKSDVHTFDEVYSSYFERNVLEKLRDIDTCVIPVNGSDNAEKRMVQLKLVTFLVDIAGRKLREDAVIAEEYDSFECDLGIEAARLKRYSDKISTESGRLKKLRERTRPEVKVSYSSMERIAPLSEEDLIGSRRDVEKVLDRISGFRNLDNWEEEYLDLISEISAYEDRLKDYGKQVNEEFHTRKQTENLVPETVTFENEKEAMKNAEEEFRLANEKAYRERGKGDSTYSALVDITNQLQVVGNVLKKLNRAKWSNAGSNSLRLILFAAAVIILPYSIMQTYIFKALLNGNILPLVCIAVLLLAVVFARPFASASLNRSFRNEIHKLSDLVKRYFDGIQQRQKLFRDNVDCMAEIWNAQRKLEACREAVSSRAENNMRIDYHRSALEEYSGMMGYFVSFIDNYYNDDYSGHIEDPVTQIDPKKDIVDNGAYWIGNVVD